MLLKTWLRRTALVVASGAVAATAGVLPAQAASAPSSVRPSAPAPAANPHGAFSLEQEAVMAPVLAPVTAKAPYRGIVISRVGLLVRNGPTTKARVIGSLRYHQVVGISCKVKGQMVAGNPRWYKLSNGTYAWASARYIANIGAAPHWC